MSNSIVRNERSSMTVENIEHLEPFLITTENVFQNKSIADCGGDTASGASPYTVSPTSSLRQTGTTQYRHPSPTHTAELMLAGGLPKNRRRPGTGSDNQCVMMTGTVTRGNSVGQPVEVQLDVTETELLQLASSKPHATGDYKFHCGSSYGPHIILWSILCIPVAMVISICVSFYIGSLTWYNLVIFFSEEKTCVHKITLCPIIILSFPVTVGMSAFFISLVASVMQVSWAWRRWLAEIRDGEKGFYGWFCGKVRLPSCSPYQVVLLDSSTS